MTANASRDDPSVVVVVGSPDGTGPVAPLEERARSIGPGDGIEIIVIAGPDTGEAEISAAVARLRHDRSLDAVARLVPVTDAIKTVAPDGLVTETLERSRLGHLGVPLAVRRSVLETALQRRDPERPGDLMGLLVSQIDAPGVL